ncbi:MAG: bacterial transcriptional activator domain-containing protein [Desulfobacteraceae bacterium]|jgi:DNA-binding SARP family transcriptional activator
MLLRPFSLYAEEKNWTKYLSVLCEKGLTWWFNLQILKLSDHLKPMQNLTEDLPARLLLLREAVKPDPDLKTIESLYHQFVAENDTEAACAAISAAWWCICGKGTNFSPADGWFEKGQTLITKNGDLQPPARARLMGDKGLYELLRFADLNGAIDAFEKALALSESQEPLWLKIYISFGYGFACLLKGEFAKLEVFEFDFAPLCEISTDNLVSIAAYQNAISFYNIVLAKPHRCIPILSKTLNDPLFERLPVFFSNMTYISLMLAYVLMGQANQVKTLAKIVQKRIVSNDNYFYHSAIHCLFGVQEFIGQNPHRALPHLQEMRKRARMCKSCLLESIYPLLVGQVLSDLNRYGEAKKQFEACLQLRLEGHNLLAAQSAMELSHLKLKEANRTEAKKFFNQAVDFLPQTRRIPIVQRGKLFTEELYASIYPRERAIIKWPSMWKATVRVTSFGHLRIDFGTGVVDEYESRASVTLALLKALIVNGGIKVPIFKLMDMLWPEIDADNAYRNFKVTLSRLRHIHRGAEEIDWVLVKQKKVSLSPSVCSVDTILFQQNLENAIRKDKPQVDDITGILDLYQDDFLRGDTRYPWIHRHRNDLREMFIKGLLLASELHLESGAPNEAIAHLDQAQKKDPLNEQVYALLMQAYMQMGYPSNAIQVYKKAKKILKTELGLQPGPTLVFLGRKANEK